MQAHDLSNDIFQLAANFVNQTNKPVFLTGKAGTGKTTFLKYIKRNTFKNTVVVAPTGVAAINAGGVTMHSFFQLPFGPFIPVKSGSWTEGVTNEYTLIKNIRFSNEKRELIRELELLIIDEASMVRADMLDAVDAVLRHFRNRLHEPFGGVQVLYIGDLFQLPPVVKNEEWKLLNEYYESPFFFHAQVIKQAPPVYIELKKIYRQSESSFIEILNNVRNNNATQEDLELLHRRYLPGYMVREDEHYITLTTHNYKADEINTTRLKKLAGRLHEFKGEITGDFNENALPVERNLQLKEGAQIMFIKNDKGEIRRYYNGKIGTIKRIYGDKIIVTFPNEHGELELEKEEWKNVRYSFNRDQNKVDEEEIGAYTQYPIRLAWAITIHKSQGLTFEKCIIDAGDAFAPGQVYVALSRLTSMEGMILRSRILPDSIRSDERIVEFSESELSRNELNNTLQEEQKAFISLSLIKLFDWSKLSETFREHYDEYAVRNIPDKDKTVLWFKSIVEKITEQAKVGEKFKNQLEPLVHSTKIDYAFIHQRTIAATDYFTKALDNLHLTVKHHYEEMKVKKRVKKYLKELEGLLVIIDRKKQELKNSIILTETLASGNESTKLFDLLKVSGGAQVEAISTSRVRAKPEKGESQRITLNLYKQEGKTIPEIAKARDMAISTIEGHLSDFILSGEIDIYDLVKPERVVVILKAIEETKSEASAPIKEKLGAEYSYGEIKAVINYRKWLLKNQEAG